MIAKNSVQDTITNEPRRSLRGGPRVLSLLPDFPLPANTGLHLRMVSNLDLMRRLGCETMVLYYSTEERSQYSPESAQNVDLFDGVTYAGSRLPQHHFTKLSLISHKLDFLIRGALGLPGDRYPFSMRYDAVGARERILEEAKRVRTDFVVLPSFLVHYVDCLVDHGYRVIADASDVLTDLTASILAKYAGTRLDKWLGLYANYISCRSQERIFLPRCSEIWATSLAEAEAFSRVAPAVNIVVVPSTLDERVFRPGPIPSGNNVGFIGTFSFYPNLEAARFLAEEVFPVLLSRCPSARLRLAGRGLPDETRERLRRLSYVDIMGVLPDSESFFNECNVVALPMFVRGGVPLKLIEAMARAKAIVASQELVAGLPVTDGTDLLVQSEATPFAEAIYKLLVDAEYNARLGRNARTTFMHHWSRTSTEEILRQESILARI